MSICAWIDLNYHRVRRKKRFTAKEKIILRPIAEVIAILDGNGFFGMTTDDAGDDTWYEQYLPEAWLIYRSNPNVIHGTSWYQDHMSHDNVTVSDAYNNWRLLKLLNRKN